MSPCGEHVIGVSWRMTSYAVAMSTGQELYVAGDMLPL